MFSFIVAVLFAIRKKSTNVCHFFL